MTHQDRRSMRFAFKVESLEGRKVLSTTGALISPQKEALTDLDLQGSAHGRPSTVVGGPDVGTTVMFRGLGVVTGLGSVKVGGSLHGTGFFAKSHVEGTIRLSNGKGSLNLQLQDPAVGGFTPPESGYYTFTSTGGTGAFKKDSGNGSVELVLGSNTFNMIFQGKPDAS